MAVYVLLSSLTPAGRETVHKNPERISAVDKEMEKFGCRVIARYALLGMYDFLSIVEAPDNETIAHLSVDLGARGTVNITTLPAIDIKTFVSKLSGPSHLAR